MTAAAHDIAPEPLQRQPGRAFTQSQSRADCAPVGADSRAEVIAAERARERAVRAAAPLHQITPERVRELHRIAQTHADHERRVVEALKTGLVTATEAAQHLGVYDLHARLTGLRHAGHPVPSEWCRSVDDMGHAHLVRRYGAGVAA